MANLGRWVTERAKEAGVDGMDTSKVNQNIIDSVVLSAYEMNDEGILDVLDTVLLALAFLVVLLRLDKQNMMQPLTLQILNKRQRTMK